MGKDKIIYLSPEEYLFFREITTEEGTNVNVSLITNEGNRQYLGFYYRSKELDQFDEWVESTNEYFFIMRGKRDSWKKDSYAHLEVIGCYSFLEKDVVYEYGDVLLQKYYEVFAEGNQSRKAKQWIMQMKRKSSEENAKTVAIYQKAASKYLDNSEVHTQLDAIKAEKKKKVLQDYLRTCFESIPEGGKILEIGSADGENARYLESLGFQVVPSDIADDFLQVMREKGLNPITFNLLEDDFPERYHGILCWRVFVHFTEEDAQRAIKKIHDALEDNGIFVFNVINREAKSVDQEWVDFPGEYHMGVDRFFHYYTKEKLDEFIQQSDYDVMDFHKEGGEEHNKWLVYSIRKPKRD